jgi:hypothetical protein
MGRTPVITTPAQGDHAFAQARKEHEERMGAIRKIKFGIEKIAEYVADANGGL